MMFLGLRKVENICCGHKMFLNETRNLFCVLGTKFVSATNVARAGKRGNICVSNNVSATMCPRLPGPLNLIWPKSSLKTTKMSEKCIFGKNLWESMGLFNINLSPPVEMLLSCINQYCCVLVKVATKRKCCSVTIWQIITFVHVYRWSKKLRFEKKKLFSFISLSDSNFFSYYQGRYKPKVKWACVMGIPSQS